MKNITIESLIEENHFTRPVWVMTYEVERGLGTLKDHNGRVSYTERGALFGKKIILVDKGNVLDLGAPVLCLMITESDYSSSTISRLGAHIHLGEIETKAVWGLLP